MTSFDPTDPLFIENPYPAYMALRESGLSGYSGDIYPISRYADVVEVLRNPEVFSSKAMVLPGQDGPDTSLIGQDPPIHTGQRQIVNRGFSSRRIAELERGIRERVSELFAKFEDRGEVELISELAAPLPVMVIAELLGLDPSRHDDFKRWSDNMIVGASGSSGTDSAFATGLEEFRDYLGEMISARREAPGEDLISALIDAEQEGGVLNAVQVLHFVQLLLAAGSETTTNLIGNAVLMLLEFPELERALRAAPSRIPQWVEETLRFESPVQLVMRRTTCEVEMAGTRIPEDALVMPLLASVGRGGVPQR